MHDRYAEYKDSGLEWTGELPAHWDFLRMKNTFTFGKGLNITKSDLVDEGIPVVSYGQIHSKNNTGVHISKNLIRYVDESYLDSGKRSLVFEGDILFADTSEDYNGVGNCLLVNYKGNIFAGYHTLIARPVNLKFPKYMAYLFQDEGWRQQVRSEVMGIKVFSLTQRILKNVQILIPPEDEREKIITYLDTVLCKVDDLIESNENQLSMLTHYKRDLIAECVTKGLDNSAPMKPSGEDWIGDVPEHWKITKLKWMFEIVKRIYGEEDRDVLAITQHGIKRKDMESNKGQYAESYAAYQVVNINDFAMNSMDLLTGWVDCSPYEGVTSPDYRVFRFYEDKPQCHAYFKYLFQMCYTNRIFYRLGQGVSNLGRWRLQTEQFRNIKLPQPPVEEQERIAAYLDEKIRQIDAVVDGITSQIKELKDYRRILIHDAVTGKIKI